MMKNISRHVRGAPKRPLDVGYLKPHLQTQWLLFLHRPPRQCSFAAQTCSCRLEYIIIIDVNLSSSTICLCLVKTKDFVKFLPLRKDIDKIF